MKRIFLFILTNLAVMVVLGLITSIFGLNRYIGPNGVNLSSLLGFS
ncbi:MAG: protease HtpX, partial [Pseudomonadota bacterium]